MMKRVTTLVCLFASMLATNTLWAQGNDDPKVFFKKMEDSLVRTADSMYNAPIQEWRQLHTMNFIRQLKQTLKAKDSYAYGFDSLKKSINIISSPDQSFRLFNWSVATTDVTLRYFAALQLNSSDLKLFPLIDVSREVSKGLDDSVFHGPRWYGGIIYHIIKKEAEGKPVYFLFSKNDGGTVSTMKLIDPMIITPNGPVFGLPIFAVASQTKPGSRAHRFVLEYKKEVQAGLNWNAELGAIVFDRLASVSNDPARKYTYAPTGQYDALVWDKDKWIYKQDVMPFVELKDGDMPIGGTEMSR